MNLSIDDQVLLLSGLELAELEEKFNKKYRGRFADLRMRLIDAFAESQGECVYILPSQLVNTEVLP